MTAQSKHTPGPWQVNGTRHSGDLKIGPNTRLHFVGPDGDAVAAVFFDMRAGKGFPDARLIAAAPDLLEALEAAVECGLVPKSSVADGGATKHARQVHVADQIRRAIAKATQP